MPSLIALALVIAAFLVALAGLLTLGLARRPGPDLRGAMWGEKDTIRFVFADEDLLDATTPARDLLSASVVQGSDWARLSALLDPRFPGLDDWVGELAELGRIERLSTDGTSQLAAEWQDGVAQITLSSAGGTHADAPQDAFTQAAQSRELDTLRAVADQTPFPMWREDCGGVSWCNRAYLDLASTLAPQGADLGWPPDRLFDVDRGQGPCRVALGAETDAATRRWFDIRDLSDGLFIAVPADELVTAEATRREFVESLSKTFASLPVGLAIFNKARELATFNPALLDLTGLSAGFLAARPTLAAFLDQLREGQMMPEPKDYKSWRQNLSDLVTAARNGTYVETWTLAGGQTYRVTGRPHPDGAIAFLIEDISDEVGTARRNRAERELSQAALDGLSGAVAVFNAGGVMTLSNAGYRALWGERSATLGLGDSLDLWREATQPTAAWDDLDASGPALDASDARSVPILLKDGRSLVARRAALPQGATLVEFVTQAERAPGTPPAQISEIVEPARRLARAGH